MCDLKRFASPAVRNRAFNVAGACLAVYIIFSHFLTLNTNCSRKFNFRQSSAELHANLTHRMVVEAESSAAFLTTRAPQIFRGTTATSRPARVINHSTHVKAVYLAVIVLIARDDFEGRQVIRDTWGRGHSNVYFIVGAKHCKFPPEQRKQFSCTSNGKVVSQSRLDEYLSRETDTRRKLEKESDVILVDCVDVYRTLAIKLKLAYIYLEEHMNVSYVLKVDFDTFVRVSSVEKWLKRRAIESNAECIVGGLMSGSVARSGKWAEKIYKPSRYPPFPSGAGHIVSRSVITYLAQNPQTFFPYQGEDTSVGIWFEKIKASMKVKYVITKLFTTHSGNCMDKSKIVVGHNINAAKHRRCHDYMDENIHD